MRFEERELKPFAEPLSPTTLKKGEVYFSITFADDEMRIPVMQTLVFIGKNLHASDSNSLYFQDVDSYQQGISYETATDESHATFIEYDEDGLSNLFDYEHALDVLMRCSLRRRGIR